MGELIFGLITTVIGIAGTLAAIWFKDYLERRKKSNECVVTKTVEEDSEIVFRLEEIRDEIGADRISVFCFHNGGEYYSGRSMQKMSCAYEVVTPGVSRTQLSSMNIPVSACLSTITRLIENKEFHCYDVEANYPEGGCKYYLIENGVKSTYQYVIMDLKKRAIGILRADFVVEPEEISSESDKSLKMLSIKLSGYLTK